MPAKVKKSSAILDLAGKRRQTLADLPVHPDIHALVLYRTGLTSLAGIAKKFPALRVLNIDDNQVTSLAPLASLPSLKYVGVSRNRLTSLRGLPRSMTALHASENAITSLAPLAKLTALLELYLDGNAIARLAGIERLRALRTLSLEGNPIAHLEKLEKLAALRELTLDGETVTSVAPATARWLATRGSSFILHADPAVLRTNIPRFLAARS